MTIRMLASGIGLDFDGTLARFGGNQELMVRFLKKFPQDESFAVLTRAMEQKDWGEAERNAHTLKGVAANLGLTEVWRTADGVVKALRADETALAATCYRQLAERWREAVAVIRTLD